MSGEPTTATEWQTTVDAANAMLVLQRAHDRGWITWSGSMIVVVGRCEELLRRGAALGYRPNITAVETLVRGFGGDDATVGLLLDVANEARA